MIINSAEALKSQSLNIKCLPSHMYDWGKVKTNSDNTGSNII